MNRDTANRSASDSAQPAALSTVRTARFSRIVPGEAPPAIETVKGGIYRVVPVLRWTGEGGASGEA